MKEIATPEIRLKILEKADCRNLHLLRTNPDVAKFIIRDLNISVLEIEQFIERLSNLENVLFYKIETFPDLELAGTIILKNIDRKNKYAEVGYELFPKFQRQGIMTIAMNEIIALAFENLGLEELEAFTHQQNIKSRKMLERFEFSMTNKVDNKNLNNVIYSLRRACI